MIMFNRQTVPLVLSSSRITIACCLLALLSLGGCGQSEPSGTQATGNSESGTDESPVATTEHGQVKGFVEDGVNVFKGIRYGADTATTRFQAPAEPEPWSEVADASAYGNSCPQIPTGSGGGLFNSWRPDPVPPLSEDCLFLNVWTPALRDGGKRPVMVWFHGGGFSSGNGSSNAYDGVRLASRGDAVVVTVNHRLNYFGYLYLGEYGEKFADSGNAGILDLVQSLEWVRDNIEEFGGDPNNVLIFGESGGGAKVSVLMAMDAAEGLFHRAVVQSGPALTIAPREGAAKATAAVVEKLGLTADTIDRILTMPSNQIEEAARAVAAEGNLSPGSRPVLDGTNFSRHPFQDGAPPQSADVPLLIGTTRTENSLLIGARDPSTFDLDWDTLPGALERYVPGTDPARVIETYRELHPEMGAAELFFTATTDARFLNNSIELADQKAQQGGAPVYMYLLNWDTPVDDGKWFSPHALEIGMVFDNVAKSESMSGVGDDQQRIADMMSKAWLAFAREGDPNHDGVPEWPAYTPDERSTMVFDLEPQVVVDPHGDQRAIFLDEG
ncbi:carboxylesterase/lipase family protein [Gilvimarinus sp. F26214L]|uniref:carboxylesterase/lipase family protein n=1 Tax=Gilvimarinus sp. DZF01 TaxID=3461371 RepID=UPI0040452BA3